MARTHLRWQPSPFALATPAGALDSLYAGGTLPTFGGSDDDAPLAVGIAFSVLTSGSCPGVRLHTATTETGTLVGELYADAGGTLLASASGPVNPGAGDYDILFAAPVSLSTSTIYVASVWHPDGRYSFTLGHYAADYTSPSGNLFAGFAGAYGPGRFVYGGAPAFPSNAGTTQNWYGVEPLFTAA